ncbi:protein of unknown function [Paramicrobacterium humi]|uniref:DUF4186 domain-containing protein n=1 Tax=Paramicrobacterium humi TaxID=640635 RepID=A0A1H4M3G4_9MICO|nr:DUF4186 domain-containing protein [Microbacterium humi]SEB77274.1 protein of unknown function [Microbacterium humi]
MDPTIVPTLRRLERSRFRAKFFLSEGDLAYCRARGRDTVTEHAVRFVTERLAPAQPHKDGKQTPWRGHPVFVAQHATATCCRGCIAKWHGIERGRELEPEEIARLVELILAWLTAQLTRDANRR